MRKLKKASDCWEWLPLEEVVVLALRAYRIAAFESVPPTGQDVWQGSREQFADDLEARFGQLLQLALRDARRPHRVNDVPFIERALAALPAEWMPELEEALVAALVDLAEPLQAPAEKEGVSLESKAAGEGAACGRGEATTGAGAKRKEGVQPPGGVAAGYPQAIPAFMEQACFPTGGRA